MCWHKFYGLLAGTAIFLLISLTSSMRIFSQNSPSASLYDQSLPKHAVLSECEDVSLCTGKWLIDGAKGSANWQDGSTATLSVERFDEHLIVICRTNSTGPSAGRRAVYIGWRSHSSLVNDIYVSGRVVIEGPSHNGSGDEIRKWNAVVQPLATDAVSNDEAGSLRPHDQSSIASEPHADDSVGGCSTDFAKHEFHAVKLWKYGVENLQDDPENAFVSFYLASKLGDPYAAYSVGDLFLTGIPLDSRHVLGKIEGGDRGPDAAEAYLWFRLSSARGYTLATDMVAAYLYFGEDVFKHSGVAKDLDAAMTLNLDNAKLHDSAAMQSVISAYRTGTQGKVATPDPQKASTWVALLGDLLFQYTMECNRPDRVQMMIEQLPDKGRRRGIVFIQVVSVRGDSEFTCKARLNDQGGSDQKDSVLGELSEAITGAKFNEWSYTVHKAYESGQPSELVIRESVWTKYVATLEALGAYISSVSDASSGPPPVYATQPNDLRDFQAHVPLQGLPDLTRPVFLKIGSWVCVREDQLLDPNRSKLFDSHVCSSSYEAIHVSVGSAKSAGEYGFERKFGVAYISWYIPDTPTGTLYTAWTSMSNLGN
jgi:hypothetical protein